MAVGDPIPPQPPDVGGPDVNQDTAWFANIKRTYDEYQNESLDSLRQNKTAFNKMIADAQTNSLNIQNVALQALQNAVETANMVGKQQMRHADVAVVASEGVAVMAEAVAATVAKSLDASVTPVLQSLVASVAALADLIKVTSVNAAPKAA